MSSNKTSNLGLHSWVRSDPFKMDEFNDNFDKLDQAVGENKAAVATIPKFACDSYTGDGQVNRKIGLDFTPKMVFVDGSINATYAYWQALFEKPTKYGTSYIILEIVEGGFQVSYYGYNATTNTDGTEYRYFAIG